MYNDIKYSDLIADIMDLQSQTKWLFQNYHYYINHKDVQQAFDNFKQKYEIRDAWLYPIAANKITVDDLEFLIQNRLIKTKRRGKNNGIKKHI